MAKRKKGPSTVAEGSQAFNKKGTPESNRELWRMKKLTIHFKLSVGWELDSSEKELLQMFEGGQQKGKERR